MSERVLVLAWLVDQLTSSERGRPLRVAVDGPVGAGKTRLAEDLCAVVRHSGRAAARLGTVVPADEAGVLAACARADRSAVLLFDGVFVRRRALRGLWDEVIYLDCDPEVARARAVRREGRPPRAGFRAVDAPCVDCCAEASRADEVEEDARSRASIVLAYDDPRRPLLLRPAT